MIKILLSPKRSVRDYHIILLEETLSNENVKVSFPGKLSRNSFFHFSRLMKKLKVNIFHTHWIHGIAGFMAKNVIFSIMRLSTFYLDIWFIKNVLKIKIVWTVNNLFSHEYNYPKIEHYGRKIFAKKADAIICHCFKAKKLIQKEYCVSSSKIHVIPMGNYHRHYKNEISKEEARRVLNINQKNFVFLSFGRIEPYKGIDLLINTYKILKTNEIINLLIVGPPTNERYKKRLIKLVGNNKSITLKFQFILDNEIQIYMNASDVVVTPYRNVLNSGEIIVAKGFGKPIIAPKLGCIEEQIDTNGVFLYNPKEEQGLRLALEKVLIEKDKLTRMGEMNLKASHKLNWKSVGKETKRVYAKILKN
jgi:glycosyltransferase involved in cell wall biosynthesis